MKTLLFAAVAILFAACTADVTEDVAVNIPTSPDAITVSFDEDSRVQLAEGKTIWTEGDCVSVFYNSDSNDRYDFMGNTGDRKGLLIKAEDGVATTTTEEIVVVYPYKENYTLSPADKTIGVTIPAVQYYENGSYGVGSNIMISTSSTDQFFLKSLCGWIKLQLTGDDKVTSITLKGNNNEQIAGKAVANYQDYTLALLVATIPDGDNTEVGGLLTNETDYIREVTLDLGDGVQLTETPTEFFFSLAPQTLTKGFTITVNFANGTHMVKSTDAEVVIKRNTVQPMDAIPVEPQPASNEIWYTSIDNEVVTPYTTDVFGATIVSNEYDATKECFVITFDGTVTGIGTSAFYNCRSLTSVTIPDSVTEIGNSAFFYCSSLTSVTIPNSVTKIGNYAFSDCSSLTSVTIPDSVTEIGDSAFGRCSLTSVTIPDSVTEIGISAFDSCDSLTSVTIPDSVTSIGRNAFRACSNLVEFNGKFASADKRCLIVDGVLNSFAPAGLIEYTIPDSVTEIGDSAFAYCSSLTSVTIPDSVTEIGRDAFRTCSNLVEFNGKFASADKRCLIVDGVLNSFAPAGLIEYTIPDSVTEIGDSAFGYCSSLTSVTIPDSVTSIGEFAFIGCRLISVTIPNSVTSIVNGAFNGCSSLTSVTIGNSVTEIGSDAFDNCSSLKSVYCNAAYPPTLVLGSSAFVNTALENIYVYAESVDTYKAKWSDYADKIVSNNKSNSDSITFTYTSTDGKAINESNLNLVVKSNSYTNGVGTLVVYGTAIPGKAFYQCTTLKTITIPDSVTKIGSHAFYNCSSLTSVTIPDSVTTIGSHTFYGCSSLTSVTIPDSVTKIGSGTFKYCSSLTSVTIPNSVTTVGINPFAGCSKLTEFNGKFASADKRCLIVDGVLNSFAIGCGLTEYTIPDSVTEIGSSAFAFCSSLTSVTIPDSVSTIGSEAFVFCSSLTTVTIPDSVTAIGDWAFCGCRSLTSVTIPDSVTEIGISAFDSCDSLTSVTIPDSVTKIGDGAFSSCSNLVEFNGKFASADKRCLIVDGVLNSFAPAGLIEYTIPDSVTEIGISAFSDCSSLTSVTIPDSVTKIGIQAFYDCSSLKNVFCKPTTPPTLESAEFNNIATDRKIYVPASDDDSIINAYKTADGWKDYADYIEEYDFTGIE